MRYKLSKDLFSEAGRIFLEPALNQGCIIDIYPWTSRESLEKGMFWCRDHELYLFYRDSGRVLLYERIERLLPCSDCLRHELIVPQECELGSFLGNSDRDSLRQRIITKSESKCLISNDNPLSEIVFCDDFFQNRPIKVLWVSFFTHIPEIHTLANRNQNTRRNETMNQLIDRTFFDTPLAHLRILFYIRK